MFLFIKFKYVFNLNMNLKPKNLNQFAKQVQIQKIVHFWDYNKDF